MNENMDSSMRECVLVLVGCANSRVGQGSTGLSAPAEEQWQSAQQTIEIESILQDLVTPPALKEIVERKLEKHEQRNPK